MALVAAHTDYTLIDITVSDGNHYTRSDILNNNLSSLKSFTRTIRIYNETLKVLFDIFDLKTKTNKIVSSVLKPHTESSYVLGSYEFCFTDDYLWVIEKNGRTTSRYVKKD